MTNLASVKKEKEVDNLFEGINITFDVKDDNIMSVRIADYNNPDNFFEVTQPQSYTSGVKVYIPAAPKMETKYLLSGELEDGLKINKLFDVRSDANTERDNLQDTYQDWVVSLSVKQVEVPEDADVSDPVYDGIPF